MKFRKKPVVIDAWKWEGKLNLDFAIPGAYMAHDDTLLINTLEGQMRCDVGDWIIKGVKGEFYPCKPDIFEATYEPV
jgi:hypothetical protein